MIELAVLIVIAVVAILAVFGSAAATALIEKDREHDEHEGGLPL